MKSLLRRELVALWHSPWQLAVVSYVPVVVVLLLWWIFSAALPRELPVALVDLDHSSISREIGRHIAASPAVHPSPYPNLDAAVKAMNQAEVFALVVVPPGFSRELMTGSEPTLDVRYNSQFLLVGKVLNASLQFAIADLMGQLAYKKQLASGSSPWQAQNSVKPIRAQSSAFFNPNNNYVAFLVPPLLIALWQLVAMLVFVNALNRELNDRDNSTPLLARIGIKFVFYAPLLLLQGLFVYAFLYGLLGLPVAASPWYLVPALLATLLAIYLIVALIVILLQEPARAVSFCTAIFAPAFAFMGITFPVQDMPLAASYWRQLLPSSHFIESHIALVSYGTTGAELWLQLVSWAPFVLLLIPIYWFGRKGLRPVTQAISLEHNL